MKRPQPLEVERECGATAVEYAIILILIAVVIFGAVAAIGIATDDALCGPVPALGDNLAGC